VTTLEETTKKKNVESFAVVASVLDKRQHIVTYMPIARQRFGKHIPEVTLSTIEGHPLLGNEPLNTHS
jgi:hypothetical protein